MSTPSTPGAPSNPAAGWYPNLTANSNVATVGQSVNQLYTLVYSLRDTLNQVQRTVGMMNQYGTDNQRQQFNPQVAPDGALWFDTDTGDSYQARLATQQTTRQWFELTSAGGAAGPEGPQGPPGPANPQNFLYNPPGITIGGLYQNNFELPLWVKVLMSWGIGLAGGIAAQIGPAPPVTQVVGTVYVPAIASGALQLETFFIVPANWFWMLSATPSATIAFTSMWY